MLETIWIRLATRSGPDKGVKRAMGEPKWPIKKLAYNAEHLNKCMEEIAEAMRERLKGQLKVWRWPPSLAVDPQVYEYTESAADEEN